MSDERDTDYTITPDQTRYLVLKILEQAVRDYCAYQTPTTNYEIEAFESTKGFIFDDNWRIGIGDWEMSPAELLDYVDVEIEWVRKQTLKKLAKQKSENK